MSIYVYICLYIYIYIYISNSKKTEGWRKDGQKEGWKEGLKDRETLANPDFLFFSMKMIYTRH